MNSWLPELNNHCLISDKHFRQSFVWTYGHIMHIDCLTTDNHFFRVVLNFARLTLWHYLGILCHLLACIGIALCVMSLSSYHNIKTKIKHHCYDMVQICQTCYIECFNDVSMMFQWCYGHFFKSIRDYSIIRSHLHCPYRLQFS